MQKILITGSNGFIGSHILNNLSKKYFFYIIVRNKIKFKKKIKNSKIIEFNNYDQLNKKLEKIKVDIIIHCATHYVKFHTYKDIEKLASSNILLGNILLENLKKLKAKKIINLSTTWIDNDGKKNNPKNLYAAYKASFNNILKYYQISNKNVKFYNLMLADTFGANDKRIKLVNVLRKNYRLNKITKIISKNLYLNLINIEDILSALLIFIRKQIPSGIYDVQNTRDYRIFDIIKKFNYKSKKKIKIKWISSKQMIIKKKNYLKLKDWNIRKSNINDIVNLISK